jgi:HlyD family secretion protein
MAKKKNATRTILIIIGIIAVLAVAAAIVAKQFLGGDPALKVEAEDAARRTVTQVVTASGKIQPETQVRISPDVSGEIIDLRVEEGDQVEQGQLLARIKQDVYEAQVEQADASVLQAKASEAQRRADLLNAELEVSRQQRLFDSGAISESELQQAQLRQQTAKAGQEASQYAVEAAQARLREAREQLQKTSIYAPMNGTISMLNVEAGDRVVGNSMMSGTEMMRIAKLDRMEIEVDVNENDVVNVALGDTAAVEIDAYPNQVFKGQVTEIANSARTTAGGTQDQVTNFPVKIRILDPHNLLSASDGGSEVIATSEEVVGQTGSPNFRPGMSGTVDIFSETVVNALTVPIQAVTVRDLNAIRREEAQPRRRSTDKAPVTDSTGAVIPDTEDLQRVVFLIEDGKARLVRVETGIADDTYIVVTSGLQDGARVITGPFRAVSRTLSPGDAVEEGQTTESPSDS